LLSFEKCEADEPVGFEAVQHIVADCAI
jgi:hypothetical protein